MAEAKFTTDHDEIREWAEARGGRPAAVRKTHGKDDPGIIRIEFPGAPNAKDAALEEISWEEFFEKFDEAGLSLLYQEKTADGQRSNSTSRSAAKQRRRNAAKPTPAATADSRKRSLRV